MCVAYPPAAPVDAAIPPSPSRSLSHRRTSRRSGRAASDGRYERNLVHELTQSTGMRNVIPPESLARFVSSSSGLSEHVLVPILFEKLEVRRGDAIIRNRK